MNNVLSYIELTKPRVVTLMLLTVWVGMHLSVSGRVPIDIFILGSIGIALCAGSAAAINHVVDRHIDEKMGRTKRRPLPTGKVSSTNALLFATVIGLAGTVILIEWINSLTAALTLVTLLGYAVVYTLFLKHATPQNIVIGGAAGAAPPLLGWTAVTGQIEPGALLLVLIIFVWTPPHFWALAIHRIDDYKKANVPMLPVTHGIQFTKLCILLYTILLFAVSLLPFVIGMSGGWYLMGAIGLGTIFLYFSLRLMFDKENRFAMPTFYYSIVYLMVLFLLLLLDHSI